MAISCFLKIEGPELLGESEQTDHIDEIDVQSWSWGISQAGTMHTATGGGAGKANVSDLSVMKYLDKASPNLMLFCASGQQFEKATLTCRKAAGTEDRSIPYFTIEMEKVIITSVQPSGTGGADQFLETVALNFAQFKIAYSPQLDDGTADTPIEAGWNIRTDQAV